MGQHTWFYKNLEKRKKEIELWDKLNSHDLGNSWLEDYEIDQIHYEISLIRKENEANYHDLFRTSKRNPNGTYTDDIITSKEECDKWLEENKETIYWENEKNERKWLNEFWKMYPNGCINFG